MSAEKWKKLSKIIIGDDTFGSGANWYLSTVEVENVINISEGSKLIIPGYRAEMMSSYISESPKNNLVKVCNAMFEIESLNKGNLEGFILKMNESLYNKRLLLTFNNFNFKLTDHYDNSQSVDEVIDKGGICIIVNVDEVTVSKKLSDSIKKGDYFETSKKRLKNEFISMKKLSNKCIHILPVHEWNENEYSYTMPKTSGSIEKLELKDSEFLMALIETLIGLQFIHINDFVHRDISPDNIHRFNGRFVLADFGAAKNPVNDTKTKITEIGKIGYTDPVIRKIGFSKLNSSTDMYSFGKTIEWVSRRVNKKHKDELLTISKIFTVPYDVRKLNNNYDDYLSKLSGVWYYMKQEELVKKQDKVTTWK